MYLETNVHFGNSYIIYTELPFYSIQHLLLSQIHCAVVIACMKVALQNNIPTLAYTLETKYCI